ncbi:MAG: hypothetical protein GY906_37160 [bacterium]|nr:hypothetical protein [bacterium]
MGEYKGTPDLSDATLGGGKVPSMNLKEAPLEEPVEEDGEPAEDGAGETPENPGETPPEDPTPDAPSVGVGASQ